MTREEREQAIAILENEKKCVNRANKNDYCNRDCYNCELVKTDTEILTALDMAIKVLQEQAIPEMYYPQVDGITPTVVAQTDGEKTCVTCRNEDTYHCAECENKSDYEQAQADGEYILKKDVMGCIDQTSLHWELARKVRKLPSVAIPSAEPSGDAISRQAVLDITWEEPSYTDALNVLTEVRDKVKSLPSANPQEPKTIQEKQAESEKYQKAYDDGYEHGYAQARFDYEQEPKTGHWIMSDDGLYRPICDKCGAHPWKGYIPTVEEATEVFKYCPNCGARMVEPQESEG